MVLVVLVLFFWCFFGWCFFVVLAVFFLFVGVFRVCDFWGKRKLVAEFFRVCVASGVFYSSFYFDRLWC